MRIIKTLIFCLFSGFFVIANASQPASKGFGERPQDFNKQVLPLFSAPTYESNKSGIIEMFSGFIVGRPAHEAKFKSLLGEMIKTPEDYGLVLELSYELFRRNKFIAFDCSEDSGDSHFFVNEKTQFYAIDIALKPGKIALLFGISSDKKWMQVKNFPYNPADHLFHELNHVRQVLKGIAPHDSVFDAFHLLLSPSTYRMFQKTYEKNRLIVNVENRLAEREERRADIVAKLSVITIGAAGKATKDLTTLISECWVDADDSELTCITGFYKMPDCCIGYDPINENARLCRLFKGVRNEYSCNPDTASGVYPATGIDEFFIRLSEDFLQRALTNTIDILGMSKALSGE